MAHSASRSEKTENRPSQRAVAGEDPSHGSKRIEEFSDARTDLFEELQESRQQWLDRARLEANLAAEFASKLTVARSFSDAVTAGQEWSKRRAEMMMEDSRHVLADAQKLMETGARILSNGWSSSNKVGAPARTP